MRQKPSTRAGFRPPLPVGPFLYQEATECSRLDGQLDESRIHPKLRRAAYTLVRLGNLVSSFQIEGIDINRTEAAVALRGGQAQTPYQQDIAAFGALYDELYEAKALPRLTPETIRAWHGRLFTPDSLDHGAPGAWKTSANGVWNNEKNDWVFIATPPEDTVPELEALLRWYHDEAYRLPPAIAAGIFFAEFECIHPFADGNGRIGRLLHLFALKQLGLPNALLAPIDERFQRTRDAYYAALETTNAGESYAGFLGYHLGKLREAYEQAQRFGRLDELFGRLPRASAKGPLEWILASRADEWFQRGDYPNEENLSSATLTNVLSDLHEMGVLEAKGERKGRKYRLDWDVIQRLQEAREMEG
jgi:Fic family protein